MMHAPFMPTSGQPRRTRWWHPGAYRATERDVAGAIYGLILATSVIGVSARYRPDRAGVTAVTVIVTATVFWLAHVYAGILAVARQRQRMPTRGEVRAILDEEWPLVQAGIFPTVILLLGPLGVLADHRAHDLAIAACLVELGAVGLVVARAAGARGLVAALSGLIALSFGVVLILLKVAVH
jgi:hypothetical protein